MGIQKDPEGTEVAVLHQMVSLKGKHILEIGCGDGRLTRKYSPSARQVTAIDPDSEAIRSAHRDPTAGLQQNVHYLSASAQSVPFPSKTFDIVFFTWSF